MCVPTQCCRMCAADPSALVISEQVIEGEVEDMIWIGKDKQVVMVLTDRFGKRKKRLPCARTFTQKNKCFITYIFAMAIAGATCIGVLTKVGIYI